MRRNPLSESSYLPGIPVAFTSTQDVLDTLAAVGLNMERGRMNAIILTTPKPLPAGAGPAVIPSFHACNAGD